MVDFLKRERERERDIVLFIIHNGGLFERERERETSYYLSLTMVAFLKSTVGGEASDGWSSAWISLSCPSLPFLELTWVSSGAASRDGVR